MLDLTGNERADHQPRFGCLNSWEAFRRFWTLHFGLWSLPPVLLGLCLLHHQEKHDHTRRLGLGDKQPMSGM